MRIALLGLNIVTGIIVARALAPSGRGEQAAIGLWPILLAGMATLGLPTALNFRGSRFSSESGRLLSAAELAAIVVGLIVAGLGAAVMPILLHGYQSTVIREAQFLMLFAPQTLLLYVLRAHLESSGEYTRSIIGQATPVLFTILALVALQVTHHLTPFSAALSYYLPPAIQTVWLATRLRKRNDWDLGKLPQDLRTLLSYGLRSYGTDVIGSLSQQVDQAIVVGLVSPTLLGLYAVALSLSRSINMVPQAFVVVMFPRASRLSVIEAVELCGRGARLSTATAFPLGVLLVFLSTILVPIAYGTAFVAVVPVVPILTLEAVLGGLATVLGQAFLATGRPAVVTAIQGVWFLVSLCLLFTLVPTLNLYGASIAIASASAIRVVLTLISYRLFLRSTPPGFLLTRADLIFALQKARFLTPSRKFTKELDQRVSEQTCL